MPKTNTIADKLLVTAYDLEAGGKRPFAAEDLAVAAWERFPNTFGLVGYHDESGKLKYPDSNRVFSAVMSGDKPLRKLGLLRKVGKKRYQLTDNGRSLAATLANPEGGDSEPEKAGFHRDVTRELRRLLGGRAWTKFSSHDVDNITFHDACGFWSVTPRSNAGQLEARVRNIESLLTEAIGRAGSGSLSFEHGGVAFTAGQLEMLQDLNRFLLDQFRESLDVIRARDDERKT